MKQFLLNFSGLRIGEPQTTCRIFFSFGDFDTAVCRQSIAYANDFPGAIASTQVIKLKGWWVIKIQKRSN